MGFGADLRRGADRFFNRRRPQLAGAELDAEADREDLGVAIVEAGVVGLDDLGVTNEGSHPDRAGLPGGRLDAQRGVEAGAADVTGLNVEKVGVEPG